MSDQGAQQPLGRLEPPEGATLYETVPLAGGKRRRADDDGFDWDDITSQFDPAFNGSRAQQLPEDEKDVNDVQTQEDASTAENSKVVKVNVSITKNEVRGRQKDLEVKHEDIWRRAIYHHEYVRLFDRKSLYDPGYTHPRKEGKLPGGYDKTAYLATQKDWGENREHRPPILFELKKPDNTYPTTTPHYLTHVEYGVPYLVIDVINNKPLRHFHHIPITVSTNIEGWLQEAWFRQDPSLQAEDLIQRMPYTAENNVYKDRRILNRLVRRRELFRDTGRCLSWTKTAWTKKWDLYLISEMNDNLDKANPNSTLHLTDLTPDQKNALKDLIYKNKKFLAKGNNHTLDGERRDQKDRDVGARLASRPAKKIKAALDKHDNGGLEAEPKPRKPRKSNSRKKQTGRNTTTVQPQKHNNSTPVVDRSGPMSQPNMESASHLRTTTDPRIDQQYIQLPEEQYGYPAPRADPQALGYPVESLMGENLINAQPRFHATDQLHDMQNWECIQPARQQLMNPAAYLDIGGNFREIRQFQGLWEHGGYGNNFGELPSLRSGTANSSTAPRQVLFQPPSSVLAGSPLDDEIRPPFYRRNWRLRESMNGNLVQPQAYPIDPQSYQSGPFLSNYLNTGEIVGRPSTNDDPGQIQFGLTQNSRSVSMQQQQQHTGFLWTGEDRHVWTDPNGGAQASGNEPYHHRFDNDPVAVTSSMHGGITNKIGERVDYPGARTGVTATAGMARPSSRKRRAQAEFDSDLVNSSRKSRKLE